MVLKGGGVNEPGKENLFSWTALDPGDETSGLKVVLFFSMIPGCGLPDPAAGSFWSRAKERDPDKIRMIKDPDSSFHIFR
jgi:hypothetical protein